MKKYIIGLCFIASNLVYTAAEPGGKRGCCCKLAQEMIFTVSRTVYPSTYTPWMGDQPRIVDKGWFSRERLIPCQDAPNTLLLKIYDVISNEQAQLDSQQQQLDSCVAKFPEEAHNEVVVAAYYKLKQRRLTFKINHLELDECRKLSGH